MSAELFGDPIHVYTDEQAIADGVLVYPYPGRFDWLLVTATVHGLCERAAERSGRTLDQVLVPLIYDAVLATRRIIELQPHADLVELEHTAAGTVWIRPNSKGGMTLMNPRDS